jgi:P27 family predicted phage terminase small subunit
VSATLKAPKGLGTAGRALWRRIVGDVAGGWELDARDLALLEAACRAQDRATELDAAVEHDGLMVAGSKGQEVLHPAVAEARLQRQLAAGLLAKVEMAEPTRRRLSDAQRNQLQAARQSRQRWGRADHG